MGGIGCEITKIPIADTIMINSTLTHMLQFCANGEQHYVDNEHHVHKAGEPFTKIIELEVGLDGEKQPFVFAFSIPVRAAQRIQMTGRKAKSVIAPGG